MAGNNINVTPVIAAIVSVLSEPYQDFLSRLITQGRITVDEANAVEAEITARGERLGDLVHERLLTSDPSDR